MFRINRCRPAPEASTVNVVCVRAAGSDPICFHDKEDRRAQHDITRRKE
jgi:pyridoxine 5'-phosphate synthase PdxJ